MELVKKEILKLLGSKEKKLFTLYLEGYGINEMVNKTGIPRKDILFYFMLIGQSILLYKLTKCSIVPKKFTSYKYLQGFKDYEKQLTKEVKNECIKRRPTKKKRTR